MRWLIIVVLAFGIVGLVWHSQYEIRREQHTDAKACVDEYFHNPDHVECAAPKQLVIEDRFSNNVTCRCPRQVRQ